MWGKQHENQRNAKGNKRQEKKSQRKKERKKDKSLEEDKTLRGAKEGAVTPDVRASSIDLGEL